jgi:methionine-S-sulfoxide reductase
MSRFACLAFLFAAFVLSAAEFPAPAVDIPAPAAKQTASVVLAGGCFWGVEAVFERLKGVTDAVSGYAGGKKSTAHYEVVSSGSTGHAESVQITYDPSQISYGKLLEVYFSVAHDPTELNRQGPDYGTQYRSAIFYSNDEQKRVAEAYIKQLNGLLACCEGILLDPVYTGKAMAGMIGHIRRGDIGSGETIIFLHTGGTPALFAHVDDFK